MTQLYTEFRSIEAKGPWDLQTQLNELKAKGYGIMRCVLTSHKDNLICLLELGWRKEDLDNAR